ncbi:SET domain-containing protein [Cucurbitaria berberidis CBS 394.84]|uniref:SET domain-containing protein n=1 Tax=Cucurbitaria berberidis CBS 394.84 TaxID=1168544 RepID=A0A9P4LEA5_9PLEO|nr:SET domain-containing protein [Cucurbitaria berberidis CBS 394.84]KAF1851182.1 SET domain-containing protein [Cucurbitaria berberidis CBS 394.84]
MCAPSILNRSCLARLTRNLPLSPRSIPYCVPYTQFLPLHYLHPASCVQSLLPIDRAGWRKYEYFWYTSSDGVHRLATSSGSLNEIPQQINDYVFNTSNFVDADYPSTFPKDRVWPPKNLQDLLCAIGTEGKDCVGGRCFTRAICNDPCCRHTFEAWKHATQDWQDHFELRKTDDRGIGVYTKRAFKKKDVLGWYAGELVVSAGDDYNNDYLMEVPIGGDPIPESLNDSDSDNDYNQTELLPPSPSSPSSSTTSVSAGESVMIDASRKGNWTRFINHSCKAHCDYRVCRVGNIRMIVVEAVKDIPPGVELTVNYGLDYYGPNTTKICHCGARKCVSRSRTNKRKELSNTEKTRVKKCRRLTPPLE